MSLHRYPTRSLVIGSRYDDGITDDKGGDFLTKAKKTKMACEKSFCRNMERIKSSGLGNELTTKIEQSDRLYISSMCYVLNRKIEKGLKFTAEEAKIYEQLKEYSGFKDEYLSLISGLNEVNKRLNVILEKKESIIAQNDSKLIENATCNFAKILYDIKTYVEKYRTIDIYVRLCEGKVINKSKEAQFYNVDERSIQRDIDDLRTFLDVRNTNNGDNREIIYDRARKGFVMIGDEPSRMSNDEILAVSKILLESRAFTKEEINSILDKMIAGCVPYKNMKLVTELIANEKYHYVELKHKSAVKDKLWQLGEEIKECNLIEIVYGKQVSAKESVKRIVRPVAIIFSEYYFYLNAFIMEKNEDGTYQQQYDYPAIFRVDRIMKYREIGEKFKIAYVNRFEEGEFRKRVQFMFPGALTRIRLKYTGRNVEAILDRLPTAKIVSQDTTGSVIEAEVYGKGILMWLLSQGNTIEVLHPQSVRDEMKKILLEMLEKY